MMKYDFDYGLWSIYKVCITVEELVHIAGAHKRIKTNENETDVILEHYFPFCQRHSLAWMAIPQSLQHMKHISADDFTVINVLTHVSHQDNKKMTIFS